MSNAGSTDHRAVYMREWRRKRKENGLEDTSRRNRKEHKRRSRSRAVKFERPFTGCDGEGCGVDDKGRQNYMLFRMGRRELYTGNRLTTHELLDFICDHPNGEILVGFAFGYDTTMILRDLSEKQQRRLFLPKMFEKGYSPYVWYKEFDIDYLPRQYLKVKRVKIERDENGKERRVAIKGSTRTIYETFGFFQKSFVKVISEFAVGSEPDRERVARNKEARSSFETIDEEVRAYCALECDMLANLMEKLRGYCNDAGIWPRSWNGAGKLAAALHSLHETPKAVDVNLWLPAGLRDFANMSYYGGRFEISRVGAVKQKVHEYDIGSAYPDANRKVPCLTHGEWEHVKGKRADKELRKHDLYVASTIFTWAGRDPCIFGGLPVRSREGHLYWPKRGAGIYWSPEITSAERMGFKTNLKEGWVYHRQCDCRPFDWIEPLFEYRKSIGKSGPGYPIKLGINSLYGKLAQRKGNGVFNNMVWAGIITALTRAKINEAIAIDPASIIMVATDAVYSTVPLDALHKGDRLGDWEETVLDGLFIVQPGLYWCPVKRKKKSRGLSGKFFEEPGRTESFEKAWKEFEAKENSKIQTDFPSVSVPVPGFIGLKLALARNKPDMAGRWIDDTRQISFDYRNKRQGHIWQDGHIRLGIKPGYPGLVSLPHRDFLKAGGQEPWENARLMLEEQPDFIDMGIPFKD